MTDAVTITVADGVAVVELHRPPSNFFDETLLCELAQALLDADAHPAVRSVVVCSEGKHFCAGADLRDVTADGIRRIYRHAFALFTARLPIVAAIQGAAIGGGLGLALAADFRVARPDSRFSANFARLGFHHGFGLTVTLPAAIGQQRALELLYTGHTINGAEAYELGLCDRLTEGDPREAAFTLAAEIAHSAPLSVAAIRATMRRRLVADVYGALEAEADAQIALLGTADLAEGIDASINRRTATFTGT
jgi:enoyl-CoA hydratase/carnithine racemase